VIACLQVCNDDLYSHPLLGRFSSSHAHFIYQAKEGDASSREALLKVRLLLCRSLGLTPSNNHGTSTWELSLPLSVATVSAAPAAEGGRSDTLSGGSTLERLQLKHAFMASTADVPNSKAWLRACLEVRRRYFLLLFLHPSSRVLGL